MTDDVAEFDSDPDKWIALQIVSGREGVNLSAADYLIMYNIDFSFTSYIQAKERMSVKDREENKVYWIFAKGGIEFKIHDAVKGKRKYTSAIFCKDYKIKK